MPERTKEAKRYNSIRIRLKLVDILFTILYLALFQIFLSRTLKAFAFSFTPNSFFAFTIYLVLFSLCYYITGFPLHFYSAFTLEHRFKLSKQRFFDWFKDDIKKGLLSLAIFLLFMHILYAFLRNLPATWWVWMAFFWFMVTVILAKATPVFIIPLFFKYYPVENGLKRRIIELSKRCGIKILDVYKIDFSRKTNKLNAALVGMGRTRRVILADNLIQDFTDEEIAGVLAHEFAHHRLLHMWKSILCAAISTFLSFYALYLIAPRIAVVLNAKGVSDVSICPAFMLVLFIAGLLLMPFGNGFSRKMEREADLFALKAIRDKSVFISLMRKLAERNLADPKPSKVIRFLFYDHPPISERIQLAERFNANKA